MNKEKVLRVTFGNRKVFEIPCRIIATNRTQYYAQTDGFKEGSKQWNEEFEQSMDDYEITDWASNNMDWEDVKDSAVEIQVEQVDLNFREEWTNAEKKVLDYFHKNE